MDFPFRSFVSILDGLSKNFDIIHFHGSDAGPIALLPRVMSSKTVITLDGFTWNRSSYPIWVRKILRATSIFALIIPNATIVDSKFVQKWYSKNLGKRPTYVPYGANIDLIEPDEAVLRKNNLKQKYVCLLEGRA
jgi:hypothetical protein